MSKKELPPVKTHVRIPAELHRAIKMEAAERGVSLEVRILQLLASTR